VVKLEDLEVEEAQDRGGKTQRPHTLTPELGVDGATTPSPDEGFQDEEKVNPVSFVVYIMVNTKLGRLAVSKGVHSPHTNAAESGYLPFLAVKFLLHITQFSPRDL